MAALADLGVVSAARMIACRECSSRELVVELLRRAESARELNAFISLDAEQAIAEADAADRRLSAGAPLGRLDGVPVTFKDNIDVVGLPTTAGSNLLRQRYPRRDAKVVDALRAAGVIVFGKTGMHEFALGATSNNAAFGAIRNPYDLMRIPGGSSGGTAAAVAARLACAGIGTDTGGSIRIPSSYCGLFGFRPTLGRWPSEGVVPLSRSRDTTGPMARSVDDLIVLDDAVVGPSPTPPLKKPNELRIGVPRPYFWGDLDPEIAALSEAALARLRSAGFELVEMEIASVAELAPDASLSIVHHEAREQLSQFFREECHNLTLPGAQALVASPDVRDIFGALVALEDSHSRARYERARRSSLPALKRAYAEAFLAQRLDAIVYPVCPIRAPLIGEEDAVQLNGRPVPAFPTLIRNSDPAAAAGLPGLAVPIGFDSSSVPVGLAVDKLPGQDRELLSLGLLLETLFPAPQAPATMRGA